MVSIIKRRGAIESSCSAYCLIMSIYCFMNFGFSQIFWIFFSLMTLLSIIYTYRVYNSDEVNKTYAFFDFDQLSIGLFLITIYFDFQYSFIGFNLNSLSKYFLVLGLILTMPTIIRQFIRK